MVGLFIGIKNACIRPLSVKTNIFGKKKNGFSLLLQHSQNKAIMTFNMIIIYSDNLIIIFIKQMTSEAQFQEFSRGSALHSVQSYIHQPPSSIKLRRRSKTMMRDAHRQSPLKKSPKDLQEEINHNYHSIINIIDHLEEVLEEKLQIHEMELLKIFKFTVQKITTEMQDIVKHYNQVIEEVKLETRVVDMENQLEFFRKEALELYQQNRFFKDQIKKLKFDLKELKEQGQIKDGTVKSLTKKICKLRASQVGDKHAITLLTEPNAESTTKISLAKIARSTMTSKTRYQSVGGHRTWIKA